MYNHIAGTLEAKTLGEAVVDANGVGFVLRIPYSTSVALPNPGTRVKLLAYLHVTDSAHTLFGFFTAQEREFFLQLLDVDGVGPKTALQVLSGGRVEDLQQAIRAGDVATLKKVKGVGEGTAKKIVLQLGKILIHNPQAAAGAKGKGAKGAPAVIVGLDADTETAMKVVAQLQQVPDDTALQAVQRAATELRAAGAPYVVQDIVQRAMKYTG